MAYIEALLHNAFVAVVELKSLYAEALKVAATRCYKDGQRIAGSPRRGGGRVLKNTAQFSAEAPEFSPGVINRLIHVTGH